MLKRILIVLAAAAAVAALAAGLYIRASIKSVPRLFKRNAELKAQGYYMGEFEFKMVALQYYLNAGRYLKAFTTLRRIRREMETTEGLARMPEGASSGQMMDFLLDRQDPSTGAFMDPRYPYFTYIPPTLNAVEALEGLARQTGRPLKVKYPLRFLDRIQTPEQLRTFLDSNLYLQERWDRLGGPGPYTAGSELRGYELLEQAGLYRFSDAWKDALRQWFYETQDPATGFWGTRIGSPAKWRQNMDANSTYHVLKLVLTRHGENQSGKYPLRYAGKLAHNLLKILDRPVPDNATAQHAWSLDQSQGAETITRLWSHLSASDQALARTAMETFLADRYRFFRPAEGGFSLYTSSTHADVDGTGNALGLLRATGSLPGTWERDRLWGSALANASAVVTKKLRRWEEAALPSETHFNSLRVYENRLPAGDTFDDAGLVAIVYPQGPRVLDVMDLRQHVAGFIATGGEAFGNWTLKQNLGERLGLEHSPKRVPVVQGGLDLARIARSHGAARRFYMVGYDVFQVPVFRLEFVLANQQVPS